MNYIECICIIAKRQVAIPCCHTLKRKVATASIPNGRSSITITGTTIAVSTSPCHIGSKENIISPTIRINNNRGLDWKSSNGIRTALSKLGHTGTRCKIVIDFKNAFVISTIRTNIHIARAGYYGSGRRTPLCGGGTNISIGNRPIRDLVSP